MDGLLSHVLSPRQFVIINLRGAGRKPDPLYHFGPACLDFGVTL
jgi:hypothetical protein